MTKQGIVARDEIPEELVDKARRREAQRKQRAEAQAEAQNRR